ncbi:hypothetical protein KBY57_13305 [Cyanobium sp. Aljojuca 7D2]|uniref:hypothetical protein n=1 Tax=Cyanobium sp. Aljojuca 7D2 TaxID=2823698 RepID=UPI0020CC1FE9|nr:hypothetical protein [Cyanobium sp. Aljojuca 7D2]MCP9892021.1 hypothetical protein [Cyanobium sp. Aljojuca 7D2]
MASLNTQAIMLPAQWEAMDKPPKPIPRETTETMVRNIGRELAEIKQAIGRSRG